MQNHDKNNLPMVVACSGAKPMGNLADQIARRLQEEGVARMVSFPGLSSNTFESASGALAPKVVVIDGCRSECAKQAMNTIGYDDCECLDLIDAGIIEPGVQPTEAHVKRGVQHVRKLLGLSP